MSKTALGPRPLAYPMPAFLVAADVDGAPNLMVVAWGGIVNAEPPMIAVAVRPSRHTMRGIRETGAFSVNVPSTALARETDYCGVVSGGDGDKFAAAGFTVFRSREDGPPMVEQCPVSLECSVEQYLELGTHVLVVGRINETWISDACLTDGKPDLSKIDPLAYVSAESKYYTGLGPRVADAFKSGLTLKK